MSCQDRLSSWKQEVSTAFAHLSKAQVLGLVLWSVGMALTGSGGINQISALLAQVLEQKEGSVFQRLREWYLDAPHKRGDHRRELEVPLSSAHRILNRDYSMFDRGGVAFSEAGSP